jgi:hypothetical protein
MGMKMRQFLEPNCKSPGSLNRPNWPNNKNSRPSRTTAIPMEIRSLPICCGPKSKGKPQITNPKSKISTKLQIANPKRISNQNHQQPKIPTIGVWCFGFWLLVLVCYLGFRICNFLQSGRQDSNLRPLAPHASALAKLRHAPVTLFYYNLTRLTIFF